MKLVIADCSAIYTGRGDTQLSRGVRSLIIKVDGSVSIHNDVGNKPLNYMKGAVFSETSNSEGERVWDFDTRKESLSITIHRLIMTSEHELIEDDPGLERDGTENQLQEWLSNNPQVLGEGYSIVSREYPTGNGPVDLLALNKEGEPVSVEVKRVAMLGAVDQTRRYIDALKDYDKDAVSGIDFSKVSGMIAALDIRPKTVEYAIKHKIDMVTIPANWNRNSDHIPPLITI